VKVTVVWATPAIQDSVDVEVPARATIAEAVGASGLVAQYGIDTAHLGFAVYGRRASPETVLAEGDRIELTRPLEIDPKSARIARARAKQSANKSPRRANVHRSKRRLP
jgi:uncharacterized protein